jgi:hypothetical protein
MSRAARPITAGLILLAATALRLPATRRGSLQPAKPRGDLQSGVAGEHAILRELHTRGGRAGPVAIVRA